MGLAEKKEKGGGGKTVVWIAAAAMVLVFVAVLAVVAYVYLSGGGKESAPTSTVAAPAAPATTTVGGLKASDILAPITRIISDISGPVNCSNDTECYHETAEKCVKSETTYKTLQATQLRRVLGEKDGLCIIYFENVDINRELTT